MYKDIVQKFDIDIDKSSRESNEYLFLTNDPNRLIYLSHPIFKKYKRKLLSNGNIKLFEGTNFNVLNNKINYKKDGYKLMSELNKEIKDYRYSTNGVVITTNEINGIISIDNETTFRCNDKNIVIISEENIPLLLINPLYNLSNSSYDKCYIKHEIIDNNKLFFEIISNNQNEIHLEVTMYSNKLIYDTIIEKENKERNNIYAPLVFFNYDYEVEELLLRINHFPLLNLTGKNVNKAYLYLPIIDKSEDARLISYRIDNKWCSFNTTWYTQPNYKKIINKVDILDAYAKIDITDYIVNIANLKDLYNPGFIIRCNHGKAILSTADSYFYPPIIEVLIQ